MHGFLDKHNWKLIETEDTALSAKHIHQHNSKHIAAIAGKLAAELFNYILLLQIFIHLKIIIQDFWFCKLKKLPKKLAGADKASVNFHTDHSKGSLAKVLTKIADGGINLSKLQSFPIPGSDWKYSFHADMEFETSINLIKY